MSDKILDKINKLLEHSRSAEKINSPEEAAAFAAQAQALLDKYNLSMSDVELHARKCEPIGYQLVPTDAPCPLWQEQLSNGIATVNGCFQAANAERGLILISGRPQDRSIAINFFKHFLSAGKRLEAEFDEAYTDTMEAFLEGLAGLPSARDSYMLGYAIGVTKRLYATYRVDIKQAQNQQALVWLDGRHKESTTWAKENLNVQLDVRSDPIAFDPDYVSMGMDAAADVALTDKILA